MTRAQGLLFAALFLAAAGFYQPVEYDNTKSRYLLLSSIVDEGRLSIDSHAQYTMDKAFAGGHYYSVKAIGLPLLAAPVYWVLRHSVLGPASALPDPTILADPWAKYLVRVATVSLPFALLGLLLFRTMLVFGATARGALWACLSYGFGTIALNNAMLFSGHDTSSFFLFSSFVICRHVEKKASREARSTALGLLAGLCAGLAVLCDYIALFPAVVLAWYAISSVKGSGCKAGFAVGAALGALALGAYNKTCFGSFASLSYSHFSMDPVRESIGQGLYGITLPRAAAAWALIASASRGLLFGSPVLLVSLAGLAVLWKRPGWRREFWLIVLASCAAWLATAGHYGWYGGWTFGPRYLVVVLPFLAVPMALAADGGPWFQAAFWISAAQIALVQMGCPHSCQEIFNPIAEFVVPLIREGGTSVTLLGGFVQYAVFAGLAVLAFRESPPGRAPRLSRGWRAALGLWSCYVALTLIFLRTPDRRAVHKYRAVVLRDEAIALKSGELSRASEEEFALAR